MKFKNILPFLLLTPALALAQSTTYHQDQVLDAASGTYGTMAMCDGGATAGSLQCSANGLKVDVQDITPGTGATDLGKAEDAAHTNGDTGVAVLTKRTDAPATSAASGNDYAILNSNAYGALYADINIDGQTSAAKGILKAEDAPGASGDAIVAIGGIYDSIGISAGTVGDYAHAKITNLGGLLVDPVGSSSRACVAIVPDTAAYAANDIVGGKQTFGFVFRSGVNSGMLQSIDVTNTEIDGIAFDFCYFSSDPSGSTLADQGAATIVAADLQKLVGCWSVADGRAFATTEFYQANGVNRVIDASAVTGYGILRTTGAPTWAAAQTVNVCLTFAQD